MSVDLKSLSFADLDNLQKNIVIEMESRRREERQKLIEEFRERAKVLGVSIEELAGSGRKTKATRAGTGVAMYANPADPSATWTGKGKRPNWFKEQLAAGKSAEDMRI